MAYYLSPGQKYKIGAHRKIPNILNEEELNALLALPNLDCPSGFRNYCMMKIMVNTGVRSAELVALKIGDIDWMSGKLTVRMGKGRKDRVLWMNEDDLEMLKEWREVKPDGPGGYLFPTLKGRQLQPRYLRAMLRNLGQKAGIEDKSVYPHIFRHTFATDLLRATKNLRIVQKALGHASIQTTQIYTHIVDEELEDAMKTFRNPRLVDIHERT